MAQIIPDLTQSGRKKREPKRMLEFEVLSTRKGFIDQPEIDIKINYSSAKITPGDVVTVNDSFF